MVNQVVFPVTSVVIAPLPSCVSLVITGLKVSIKRVQSLAGFSTFLNTRVDVYPAAHSPSVILYPNRRCPERYKNKKTQTIVAFGLGQQVGTRICNPNLLPLLIKSDLCKSKIKMLFDIKKIFFKKVCGIENICTFEVHIRNMGKKKNKKPTTDIRITLPNEYVVKLTQMANDEQRPRKQYIERTLIKHADLFYLPKT
jgi:hypothetical protein